MTCNHDDSKKTAFIDALSDVGHEVYMCECGALFDIRDPRNHSNATEHMMDSADLSKAVHDIIRRARESALQSVRCHVDNLLKR